MVHIWKLRTQEDKGTRGVASGTLGDVCSCFDWLAFPPSSGGPLPGLQAGESGPAWQQHHRSLPAGPPPSPHLPAQAGPPRPRQPLHVWGVPLQGGAQEAGICFSGAAFDRSRANFEQLALGSIWRRGSRTNCTPRVRQPPLGWVKSRILSFGWLSLLQSFFSSLQTRWKFRLWS